MIPTVERIGDWLGEHFLLLYRVARPPWLLFRRLLNKPSYWEERRDDAYYREAIRLAKTYAPTGGTMIDVGSNETQLLARFGWFSRRVALDIRFRPPQPNVETVIADFMDYQTDSVFDLVLCLEVLEHLQDPTPFAQKLLAIGTTVIISVPYKWRPGTWWEHIQDPVDEAKLEGWTRIKPIESIIVADRGKERLVAVYQPGEAGIGKRSSSTKHEAQSA